MVLANAVKLEIFAIDEKSAFGVELDRAEAENVFGAVNNVAVCGKLRYDGVKIRVFGIPKARIFIEWAL